MQLAHEYNYKPSASMLAPDTVNDMECVEGCRNPNFDEKFPLNSPKKQDPCPEIKENEKLDNDNTFFAFLDLPREIRDDIYVRVLGSSKEHWAVMTASVPWTKYGRHMPHTRFEYSFRSKQLQLLCYQIRMEVLELSLWHAQNIWLRELEVVNFDAVLNTFKCRELLRLSARNITLIYSTPILCREGEFKGRSIDPCSFLSQIVEPFVSLIKLCPNVESAFVSLLSDHPTGPQCQLGLFVPCHNRDETIEIEVDNRWYEVAEWEYLIRAQFSSLQNGIQLEENIAVWDYSCKCVAYANFDIAVSNEEKSRARQGVRRINATIIEKPGIQSGSDDGNGEDSLDESLLADMDDLEFLDDPTDNADP
ncbi:hypothetical protein VE03_07438 [Pseudogymnoascus sp. 23342-1-I1]|nr:hypothetical protein VE03_07438 [Pseudogymnoascus sp. 23342-1-I1]